ncbi:NTP binding protein P-S8 [Mal de Rio Cuarto virus]|uniref:NTP binding protein P-S8 n=1 Tax=Mal de Rio Cuarto virus TaxID=185954 RepID=Q8BE70_9REOV|nr:NTP binding protein P-S8 [Mal de Rio Cuarto virus]AAN07092.1 NTP binding protein P-S8 [Mal de Rio Cuarto virus]
MTDETDTLISLRLLFFNLWNSKQINNPIHHRNQNKLKKQKITSNLNQASPHPRPLIEYEERLADEFAKANRQPFKTCQLLSAFSRLETIFSRMNGYFDLFSNPIRHLGFIVLMTNVNYQFDPPSECHNFYTLKKNHGMTFNELEFFLNSKMLLGQIIKTTELDFSKQFETYYFDPRSEKTSYGFLKRMALVRFDFLSYNYVNDLTATEVESLPPWISSLLLRMNITNSLLSREIFRDSIDPSQHYAVIVLKNDVTNVTLGRFWTVLDDHRPFIAIKTDIQKLIFENSIEAKSGNIKHVLNNCLPLGEPLVFNPKSYKFRLSLIGTGLSPLDDLVIIRLKDLINVFKQGHDVQVIGNKGVGKTEIGRMMSDTYPHLLVIDSDDYGRFLTFLLNLTPNLFKNSDFEINDEMLTDDVYFEAMSQFITGKRADKHEMESLFDTLMGSLIAPNTSQTGDVDGESILDAFNRVFHLILGSQSIGYKKFIIEYTRIMYTNFEKTQTLHFVHSYCELAFVPHSLAYLTLHSSFNSSVLNLLTRKDHSGDSASDLLTANLLYHFYDRYTTDVNPTSVFLFKYHFGLTKGLNVIEASKLVN